MSSQVLFVCTGNTCRSPLAELAARKQFAALGLEFGSAGLQVAPGLPAAAHSLRVAEAWGGGLAAHASTQLTTGLATEAKWLIGMTRSHGAILRSRFAGITTGGIGILGAPGVELQTMRFSPSVEEVDDPFGESFETYQACGQTIWNLVAGWAGVFAELTNGRGASR